MKLITKTMFKTKYIRIKMDLIAAAVNAGVFAVCDWGLSFFDKKQAETERERHDRALEKFQKEKVELDKEMEKHRLKMERQRNQLEAAGVDLEAADKDLYAYFQVTKPRFEYTPGTNQKTAEAVVVGGSLIGVITGVLYVARR